MREEVAEVADLVFEQHHHGRADDGAGQRAEAAHQRHQHDVAGRAPVHVGQRGKAQHQRLERTGETGDRCRDHERQQLEAIGVVAQRDGARFVFLDALEHLTERRVDGAHDHEEGDHDDGQAHVVHGHVALQIEHAEQLAARHALQAVFTAGERQLQAGEVQHLRERQCDHRGIDALTTDRKEAHHQTEQSACHQTEQQTDFGRHAPDLDRLAGDVGRAAKERGVTERQQTGVAQQQVEGRGEQRERHQLHDEHRIGTGERRDDQAEQKKAITDGSKFLRIHVTVPLLFLFAEQAGGADEQNDGHDDEHHGGRGFRIEHLGETFDHAKAQTGEDGAHDGAHAADHDHREHHDDEVLPHERSHLIHGRCQHTGERGERGTEGVGQRDHHGHVDAEGFDESRIFRAGAQIGAELGLLDHVPGRQAHDDGGHHHPCAVVGQHHEAEVGRAFEQLGRVVAQTRDAVDRAEHAFDHQREAEREQQTVEVIELVDPAQHRALDDHTEHADDQRSKNQHHPVVDAEVVHGHPGEQRPKHEQRAVREVDHVEQAEDHGQTQTEDRVERAIDQPQKELAQHGR